MERLRVTVCVLASSVLVLSFTAPGCGSRPDHGADETDPPAAESIFQPYVGAIDNAHGVQDAADEHNEALNAALRGNLHGN